MNAIIEPITRLYYRSKGIDLDVLRSKKDGVWFRHGANQKTVGFLRFQVYNNQGRNLIRLLELSGEIFSCGGEIIGRNETGKRVVEIGNAAFSREQQERAKLIMRRLLDKRKISGIAVSPLQFSGLDKLLNKWV